MSFLDVPVFLGCVWSRLVGPRAINNNIKLNKQTKKNPKNIQILQKAGKMDETSWISKTITAQRDYL